MLIHFVIYVDNLFKVWSNSLKKQALWKVWSIFKLPSSELLIKRSYKNKEIACIKTLWSLNVIKVNTVNIWWITIPTCGLITKNADEHRKKKQGTYTFKLFYITLLAYGTVEVKNNICTFKYICFGFLRDKNWNYMFLKILNKLFYEI